MKRAALVVLAAAAIAGCSSTVYLGSLPSPVDMARPTIDISRSGPPIDLATNPDGFDGGILDFGLDGGTIDLAH